jgi:hypothetical protein
MKTKLFALFISIISLSTFAQDAKESKLLALESIDTTKVVKEIVIEERGVEGVKVIEKTITTTAPFDTTTIRFGKRRIVIIEKDGTTSIEIPEKNDVSTYDSSKDRDFVYKKKAKFKGHWAGFEWGFNGLMDANNSINLKDDLKYLELSQGRSWNFNLNVLQYSLGFGTDKVGLVTGLGFEWNNYHFRNQTSIKVVDGITVEDDSYFLDPNKIVTKSKLSMSHLTVPLLLEFQIPTSRDRHRIFFSTGLIGGVRLGSHTKVVYEGATKGKDKVRNDYNLSQFRYGVTARVGYRNLKLFANYYPTALFEEGKGPEVYPFSIGLILLSF